MLYTIGPLVLSSPAVTSAMMRGSEANALISPAVAANKVLTVARDVYEGRQAARRIPTTLTCRLPGSPSLSDLPS